MFSYIIGEVKLIGDDYIVLENNNIGYKIYMSQKNISSFVKNETRKVYTEFIVREDAVLLYGFIDFDEVEMFLNLNQVSGVGPKAALSILSTLSVYKINLAIIENNIVELSKSPGIGKKTASRIILELTDKIDLEKISGYSNNETKISNINNDTYNISLEALINLGYNKIDAEKVLQNIDFDNMELSDIIKTALKRI